MRVVPRLYLSEAASLCLLSRPESTDDGPERMEDGPGSGTDCPREGVPGTEDTGVSTALSPRLLEPMRTLTRSSTSRRTAELPPLYTILDMSKDKQCLNEFAHLRSPPIRVCLLSSLPCLTKPFECGPAPLPLTLAVYPFPMPLLYDPPTLPEN